MQRLKPTLYLIRGVPGSGKSTFAIELYRNGIVQGVYEADAYFTSAVTGEYKFDASKLHAAHLNCQQRVLECLLDGKSAAVSNTSTTEKEVEVYRKIAEDCKADFVSIVVESRHDGKNTHCVPEEKIKQMKDRFSIKL